MQGSLLSYMMDIEVLRNLRQQYTVAAIKEDTIGYRPSRHPETYVTYVRLQNRAGYVNRKPGERGNRDRTDAGPSASRQGSCQ